MGLIFITLGIVKREYEAHTTSAWSGEARIHYLNFQQQTCSIINEAFLPGSTVESHG